MFKGVALALGAGGDLSQVTSIVHHALLSSLVSLTRQAGKSCPWSLYYLDGTDPVRVHQAAFVLAAKMVAYRCRGAPRSLIDKWVARRLGGPPGSTDERGALRTYVQPSIGTPTAPTPASHLEGAVGEHLWYFLHREARHAGAPLAVEGPTLSVTSQGGDGLSVMRRTPSQLGFRIWELKKYSGSGGLSGTSSAAYAQLKDRAASYLAEYSALSIHQTDAGVRELYMRLVELWLTNAPEAGAGVSIATHATNAPSRCFTGFSRKFPKLSGRGQLEGVVVAVDDFPRFARLVRMNLWKGL